MDFINRIRSKPKIWTAVGILLAIIVVLAVFIWHKGNTEPTDQQIQSDEIAATENLDESSEQGDLENASDASGEVSLEEISEDNSGQAESIDKSDQAGEESAEETEKDTSNKTESNSTVSQPADTTPVIIPEKTAEPKVTEVSVEEFARFSGQFVEDGLDELVENVAAIRVTNQTDQYLEYATLEYEIDGKEAVFEVSGLPAGRSAWVMEASRMVISDSAEFGTCKTTTALKEGVTASTDKISFSVNVNMMTATNNSQETLEGVYVYYKTLYADGNFFGGITYLVDFGTLEPGESVEMLAGHYEEGKTEIVRVGWKNS